MKVDRFRSKYSGLETWVLNNGYWTDAGVPRSQMQKMLSTLRKSSWGKSGYVDQIRMSFMAGSANQRQPIHRRSAGCL